MAIDFTIPEDAKEVRARVRKWVQEECIPAEKEMAAGKPYKTVLKELRTKARAQGLWLPFFPVEHGGMGLGPLANALVQMELGQSHLGGVLHGNRGDTGIALRRQRQNEPDANLAGADLRGLHRFAGGRCCAAVQTVERAACTGGKQQRERSGHRQPAEVAPCCPQPVSPHFQ